jgi:hypothetical protein
MRRLNAEAEQAKDTKEGIMSFHFPRSEPPHDWRRFHERLAPHDQQLADVRATLHAAAATAIACAALLASAALA